MKNFYFAIIIIALLYIFIKTLAYGKWTWNRNNRLGGAVIIIIAIAQLIVPVCAIYLIL